MAVFTVFTVLKTRTLISFGNSPVFALLGLIFLKNLHDLIGRQTGCAEGLDVDHRIAPHSLSFRNASSRP